MKDLFSILTTILFVAIALLAGGKKRKIQSAKTEEEPEEAPEWLPIPGMPFPTRPRPVATEAAQPVPRAKRPAASQPAKPKKRIGEPPKRHPDSPIKPNRAFAVERSIPTETAVSGHPEPTAEQHPDIADFDLRRAVIWSEILQPKFEEK